MLLLANISGFEIRSIRCEPRIPKTCSKKQIVTIRQSMRQLPDRANPGSSSPRRTYIGIYPEFGRTGHVGVKRASFDYALYTIPEEGRQDLGRCIERLLIGRHV